MAAKLSALRAERLDKLREVYTGLSAWQTVRVSRHPKRPQTRDYIDAFWNFEITPQFQMQYGYPALSKALKDKGIQP